MKLAKQKFSDKQESIALLLLEGKRRKEVCDTLKISSSTLTGHLERIYKKTGKRGIATLYLVFYPIKPNTRRK